jgi:phenylalanyl-tRNA synthetase beta chain
MLISHEWLQDYVAHDTPPAELAELLTHQAVPIEAMEELDGGDTQLELEVTYNRPDLLSHLGVAREVSAATGVRVREPETGLTEDADATAAGLTSVALEAPELCPIYTARVIRGVKVAPSPGWLEKRIESIGLRPVNNVVDITNFVMHECGQPLHAFDMAKLAEGRIVVRRATEGEPITLIDGSALTLTPETLVIADAARPMAVAGVMGGLDSEISEQTTDVLLESAYFDPVTIRKAVRRLKVSSDSSYRFERGADPAMAEWASRRAARLILELAGGALAAGVVREEGPADGIPAPRQVRMRLDRLRLVAGVDISRKQAAKILSGLGLEVLEQETALTVTVPTARHELTREIDLIEEVLRVHGYDKVPLLETVPVRAVRHDPRELALRRVREVLVGAGCREIHTISFVAADDAVDPPLFTQAPALAVRNPVRADTPVLRRSLYAGLCEAKRTNADKGTRTVRLFEASTVYLPQAGGQPDERLQLGVLLDDGFYEAKGVLEELGEALRLDLGRLHPVQGDLAGFDPLERAEVRLGAERIGWLGRIGAGAMQRFGSDGDRPAVLLLDLEPVLAAADLSRTYAAPSPYPEVTRDLAAVVDARTYVGDLLASARGAGAEALRRVELLSVFDGDGRSVPAGSKSVAFRMAFQSFEGTLTGDDADRGRELIKQALVGAHAASFRE